MNATWHRAFPDFRAQLDSVVVEGDQAVVRFSWEGTHSGGDLMGVKAAGRRVSCPAEVHWLEVRDWRIVRDHAVMDLGSIVNQAKGLGPQVTPFHVGRHVDPSPDAVNTYWIETSDGVIVVGGPREAAKARKALEPIRQTRRPILAAFATHPHPDPAGGVSVFAEHTPGVPVYASRPPAGSGQHAWSDGQQLIIGGVRIVVHELGSSEAERITALHLPNERVLFITGSLQARATAYALEGRSAAWLERLDGLRRRFPDVALVYPGHGEPGVMSEVLDRQADCLATFQSLLAQVTVNGKRRLDRAAAQRVADTMAARYPNYLKVSAVPELLKMDLAPRVAA